MSHMLAKLRSNSGQTLVWVAIALVVLLGFVALAVDGGLLLSEKRVMQNAADAAALEAARARCYDNASVGGAITAGQTFAATNYNPRPFSVGSPTYSVTTYRNDWEFQATATETVRMSFARVLGIGQVNVSATAAAACGASPNACGVFPLAFSQDLWDDFVIPTQCGQNFFVWTGEAEQNSQGADPPSCDVCDCTKVYDNNGNLLVGVIAAADTGRAWLDFSSSASPLNPVDCASAGCGANELRCWINSDAKTFVLANSCVSGTDGIKLGVKTDLNAQSGQYKSVPLFDGRCIAAANPSTCDANGFHISSFGCVQIVGLESQAKQLAWKVTPTPAATGNYAPCMFDNPSEPGCKMCLSEKMLQVKVGCNPATGQSYCTTDCAKVSQGGDPGASVKGVSLIR